jgi:GT2 family glycosyltransferase
MERTEATVSLCIICHDRPDELLAALESSAREPWHEVLVLDMASDPPLSQIPGVKIVRSTTNLGPAAGRNRLADLATGDLLVYLDDDVVLTTPVVDQIRHLFGASPLLALVAFRVERSGAKIESREYPFRGSVRNAGLPRRCTYFVAAGYASRRSAVIEAAGYDEALFIYSEELELSFNLLSRGWTLWYEPAVVVEHRPSERGRSGSISAYTIRNRVLIVRRYLPWFLQPVHLSVWCVLTVLQAARAGAISAWLRGLRDGWQLPVRPRRLSWLLLVQIHRLGGRILY